MDKICNDHTFVSILKGFALMCRKMKNITKTFTLRQMYKKRENEIQYVMTAIHIKIQYSRYICSPVLCSVVGLFLMLAPAARIHIESASVQRLML